MWGLRDSKRNNELFSAGTRGLCGLVVLLVIIRRQIYYDHC